MINFIQGQYGLAHILFYKKLIIFCKKHIWFKWHTIKPGTPEHGIPKEDGTRPEQQNTTGTLEHPLNDGTLPEQSKDCGTVEHYNRALAE